MNTRADHKKPRPRKTRLSDTTSAGAEPSLTRAELELVTQHVKSMMVPGLPAKRYDSAVRALLLTESPEGLSLLLEELQFPLTAIEAEKVDQIVGPRVDPTFLTDRLAVYRLVRKTSDMLGGPTSLVYVAFHKAPTIRTAPVVVATALIGFYPWGEGLWRPTCDWIEVSESCRREGFGTELFDGVERHTGWTIRASTTPGFLRAILKARRARVRERVGDLAEGCREVDSGDTREVSVPKR